MKTIFLTIIFSITLFFAKAQDTFSIVAVDSISGEVGSAGASCVDLTNFPGFTADFLGELFPNQGAINTQAFYLETNQANARNRMNMGDTPEEIIQWLIDNDVQNQPQFRQYGIVGFVNGVPMSAAHTGSSTDDFKGHNLGETYSIQGNILSGQQILDNMEAGFLNTEGDLACKLMGAMQGANEIGADARCESNGTSSLFAFLKVAQPDDIFGNPSFSVSVITSDGDGIEPIDSLQILFDAAHEDCGSVNVEEENILKNQFQIFPNPVTDKVTVQGQNNGNYELKLFNSLGKLLNQMNFQKSQTLNLSTFPKGIYYLEIAQDGASFSQKLVKE